MKTCFILFTMMAAVATAAPSGSYKGSTKVLGQQVNVALTVDDASHADLSISGILSVTCPKEAYNFDGKSSISLPNAGTAGDCVHDALAKAPGGGSIKSIAYDSGKDAITVTVHAVLDVKITLTKAGEMTVEILSFPEVSDFKPLLRGVEACTTYRKVTNGECAEACLGSTVGACPVSLVVKFGKLDKGICADAGYTKSDGSIAQKAGPCGTITFKKYAKPSAAIAY
jgi:hypothetical protein